MDTSPWTTEPARTIPQPVWEVGRRSGNCVGASSIRAFEPGGVVTGEDAGGCTYSGRFAAADPQFLYDLDLTITGCLLEGRYAGVGHPHSGPFNDILEVALDDGDQRALLLYFGSKFRRPQAELFHFSLAGHRRLPQNHALQSARLALTRTKLVLVGTYGSACWARTKHPRLPEGSRGLTDDSAG